jgi:hypothetical protein
MHITVEEVESAFEREVKPATFVAYKVHIPALLDLFDQEAQAEAITSLRLVEIRRNMAGYLARERIDSKPRQLALQPYIASLDTLMQNPPSNSFDYLAHQGGLRKAGNAYRMGIIATLGELLREHPSEFFPPLP